LVNFVLAAAFDGAAGAATTAETGTDSAATAVIVAVDSSVSMGFLRMSPPAEHVN
jgi:hypothetical protein